MARRNFVRSFRLLVLLCSVAYSVQKPQDQPSLRTGKLEQTEADDQDDDRSGYITNYQQPGLQHYMSPNFPVTAKGECLYPDQRLYLVDGWGQCQVCICVQRFYPNTLLEPVCGNCNQCGKNDNSVTLPPPLPTTPHPLPPPPPPPPSPTLPPRCDPLPTNQYYPNPLDPCQTCVCKQTEDMFGIPLPPVIECQDNHQCVIPTTHPPPPPGPPAPLPVCNYYPQHVLFPHPQYSCLLCKCEGSSLLHLQPTISCYPDPICEPTPGPLPPPTTLAPPIPQPPKPNHVDPLPGPSPHPSCRPFTPNRPFQHPWDVCLECVCTEANVGELTNVQVNCFTRPECCIAPETGSYISYPGPMISSQLPASQGSTMFPTKTYPYLSQRDSSANAIAELNEEKYSSANAMLNAQASGEMTALAQATADTQSQHTNQFSGAQAQLANQYPYPQQGQFGGTDSYASANILAQAQANQAQNQAMAQALAQAQTQGLLNYDNYPTNYGTSGAYSNAQANTGYNALSQRTLHIQPNQYGQTPGFEPVTYFYNRPNDAASYAQAEASAQRDAALAEAEALNQAEASFARGYAQNGASLYPSYPLPQNVPYYTKPIGYDTALSNDLMTQRMQTEEAYAMPSSVQLLSHSSGQAQSEVQPLGNLAFLAKGFSDAQTKAASQQLHPTYFDPLRRAEPDENTISDRAAQEQGEASAERAAAQAQVDAIAQIVGDRSQSLPTGNLLRADSTQTQPSGAATLKSANPDLEENE